MNSPRKILSQSQIDEAASDWVIRRDAGFTESESKEFACWQATDPRHAEAVARHDRAWSLLDRPRAEGRSSEMTRALAARTARRKARRIKASALALIALVGVGLFWQTRESDKAKMQTSSAIVVNPQFQHLPDGTVVELKTGAEIAVDFTGPLRRVTLVKGVALFQVAKNPDRAFVVTAAGVQVRAVGTAFTVELGAANVDVVVTEGKVAVGHSAPTGAEPIAAENSPSPTLVQAGKRVTVDLSAAQAVTGPVELSAAELSELLAWRKTRLEFSETPLAEAIALMNRHSQTQLVLTDPALGSVPVSGIFRADNTDTLVRLMEANFGITAERVGQRIILRKAR